MFSKVVVAVDGSEHSAKAVPIAAELAAPNGAEVLVLHVLEHEATWVTDIEVETPIEASDLVDRFVRQLKDSGVGARGEVVRASHGQMPRAIVRLAEAEGADAIVMGNPGRPAWGGPLIGSVTHKVVSLAECPVLVVR